MHTHKEHHPHKEHSPAHATRTHSSRPTHINYPMPLSRCRCTVAVRIVGAAADGIGAGDASGEDGDCGRMEVVRATDGCDSCAANGADCNVAVARCFASVSDALAVDDAETAAAAAAAPGPKTIWRSFRHQLLADGLWLLSLFHSPTEHVWGTLLLHRNNLQYNHYSRSHQRATTIEAAATLSARWRRVGVQLHHLCVAY